MAPRRHTANGTRHVCVCVCQQPQAQAASGCQGARRREARVRGAHCVECSRRGSCCAASLRHSAGASAGATAGAPSDLSESPTAMAVGRTVALSHSSVLSTTAASPLVSTPAAASTPAPAPAPAHHQPNTSTSPASRSSSRSSHGCRVAGRERLGLVTIAQRQRHGNGRPACRLTTRGIRPANVSGGHGTRSQTHVNANVDMSMFT
jgi:hypothetical protein